MLSKLLQNGLMMSLETGLWEYMCMPHAALEAELTTMCLFQFNSPQTVSILLNSVNPRKRQIIPFIVYVCIYGYIYMYTYITIFITY